MVEVRLSIGTGGRVWEPQSIAYLGQPTTDGDIQRLVALR
jgi:hypothetical protein